MANWTSPTAISRMIGKDSAVSSVAVPRSSRRQSAGCMARRWLRLAHAGDVAEQVAEDVGHAAAEGLDGAHGADGHERGDNGVFHGDHARLQRVSPADADPPYPGPVNPWLETHARNLLSFRCFSTPPTGSGRRAVYLVSRPGGRSPWRRERSARRTARAG